MKILVYRRTHTGDPDPATQIFGIHDCMGSVRNWAYDAVIGIGGAKPDNGDEGIKEKITWVGIYPIYHNDKKCKEFRGKLVSFEIFKLWDEGGKPLKENYPKLYKYMFTDGRIPRAALNFPKDIFIELLDIIRMTRIEVANDVSKYQDGAMLKNSKNTNLRCGLFSEEETRKGCI